VDGSPDAVGCDCGGRGHLGAIASGRGIVVRARARAEADPQAYARSALATAFRLTPAELSAESIAAAHARGDAWATACVEDAAGALGAALAAVHLAIGTERFVLIGGLALGLGPRFCEAVASAIAARCWRGERRDIAVSLGETDGRCALFGGARAAASGWI
jgi:glucokinase